MYDAKPGSELGGRYPGGFHKPVAFARRRRLARETKRLEKRLAEIKMIYRHQFPA
jgi:hypothetical protein